MGGKFGSKNAGKSWGDAKDIGFRQYLTGYGFAWLLWLPFELP